MILIKLVRLKLQKKTFDPKLAEPDSIYIKLLAIGGRLVATELLVGEVDFVNFFRDLIFFRYYFYHYN